MTPHDSSRVAGIGATHSGALKRLGGLAFVIGLHAVVLIALIDGTARRVVVEAPRVVMASILSEPEAPAPLMPSPAAKPVPVEVPHAPPPPVVHVKRPPPPTPHVVAMASTPSPAEAPPPPLAPVTAAGPAAPAAEPVRSPAKADGSHSCQAPGYPVISRRLGEAGAVVVKFLIDEDGTVVDSMVETSSGHPRLDEAARDALSLCRFIPGTVDGKPERAWARIQYVWKLN